MVESRNSGPEGPGGSPPAGGTQHRLQNRTRARTGPSEHGVPGLKEVPELEIGQFSHPGRKRSNNEDWLGTFQPEDADRLAQKGSLFLLADGMGGHQSGELASRKAVDRVIRSYMEVRDRDVAASLQLAVQAANDALCESAARQQQGRNSGTTLVAAVIRRGELWVANVGDSRAYLLRRGVLEQISVDHSWASVGAQAGLSEEWVGRHILTRALGAREQVEVDVFGPWALEDGDRLILCSDGLTTPLADPEIREIAARYRPQKASEALVQAANERGGPDNVSVLVVEVKGPGRSGRAGRPMAREAGRGLLAGFPGLGDSLRALAQGRLRPSPALIAAAILAALALLGLGFALGTLLFGR
jgi:serine/threonine protein phosphatase PrpC